MVTMVSRVMPGRIEAVSGGVNSTFVAHDEQVLPAAFADEAGDVERDALRCSRRDGFHLDELRVRVVGRGLGHRRERVRRHAIPRADAHVHALLSASGPR